MLLCDHLVFWWRIKKIADSYPRTMPDLVPHPIFEPDKKLPRRRGRKARWSASRKLLK